MWWRSGFVWWLWSRENCSNSTGPYLDHQGHSDALLTVWEVSVQAQAPQKPQIDKKVLVLLPCPAFSSSSENQPALLGFIKSVMEQ